MLVRHFMATDVFTLAPDQTCREALAAFRQRRIRRAPVVEADRLIGIVSERDLLHILPGTCAQASTQAGEASMVLAVRHVMHTELITAEPNDHLTTAARLMLKHRIGGIPVVHEGRLRGIITESDIFKALYGILTPPGGMRVIFEEVPPRSGEIDYAGMCARHYLRLHTFLKYPGPEGGAMVYLCAEGDGAEAFVRELWTRSCRVVSVEFS
jgi:acetoin utilization protein AcuB